MTTRARIVALAALAALLAGLPSGASSAARTGAARGPATAVVAVVDSGINPYHRTFRDSSPAAQRHPSTRFPGYPSYAQALRLSLAEEDFGLALEQDCERVWSKVAPGRLYWIPGTTIVGAISFTFPAEVDCERATTTPMHIVDRTGHGTMTASRAVGRSHGACRGCPVVAVQGFTTESVDWTGTQAGWLDVESHSWGPTLPGWVPVDLPVVANVVNGPRFVRAVESAAQAHLAFWASGNGIGTRLGVLGHPTQIDPRLTPSVLSVGGHDSGRVITWPDAPPHLASDACDSWAAKHDSTTEEADTVGGGTSGATPYVAGGALSMLIEARRLLGDLRTGVRGSGPQAVVAAGRPGVVRKGPLADGRLTLAEWRRVLLTTATARPRATPDDGPPCVTSGAGIYTASPVEWSQLPPEFPEHLLIGYGAVDVPAVERARAVLRGRAPLPERTRTDEYFARDAEVRARLHQVFRGP